MDWEDELKAILESQGVVGEVASAGHKVGNLLEITNVSAGRDEILIFLKEAIAGELAGGARELTFAVGGNLAEKLCADPETLVYLCFRVNLPVAFDAGEKILTVISR